MGRKEVAQGLTELLRIHLDKKHIPYAEEVTFWMHDQIRPDFVAVDVEWKGSANICHIEQGEVNVYEIKSCVADFKSGHGLNMIGDNNFIVIPYEVSQKILKDDSAEIPYGWVFAFPVPKDFRGKKFETIPKYEGQVEGWRLSVPTQGKAYITRHFAISEVLWAMIHSQSGIKKGRG